MDMTTTSAGGLAMNPDGTLADLPSKLTRELNAELLDVLALLRAIDDAVMSSQEDGDEPWGGLQTSTSRASALLYLAGGKVRSIIGQMGPYV